MWDKLFVVLLIVCMHGPMIHAQQMRYTELPTQDRLPVAHIHRIFQDREGYMWYATETGGLCRDNGYQVDVFRSDARTPYLMASNEITCLAEDSVNKIWVGTDAGVYCLDKRDYTIRPLGVHQGRTEAVFTASDGSVWLSTGSVIWHLTSDGDSLQTYASQWNGVPKMVNNFYEDTKGRLWATQWQGGVIRLDEKEKAFVACPWPCDASPVQLMETSVPGTYWVGTWGRGVVSYSLNEKNWEATVTVHPETWGQRPFSHQGQVLSFLSDGRRQLMWVSAMDDLYAYCAENGLLKSVGLEEVLPGGKKILDRMIADRAGNIWVPGYSPHTFILSDEHLGIRRDPVKPMSDRTGYRVMADRVVKDGSGYWIWQGRTGLSWYAPLAATIEFSGDHTTGARCRVDKEIVKRSGASGIWAIEGNRLIHVWHAGNGIEWKEEMRVDNGGRITALMDDGKGRVWIGSDDGLFCYVTQRRICTTLLQNTGRVRDIARDGEGKVYLISDSLGFVSLTPDGNSRRIVADEEFSSLAVARDGTVWVASLLGKVYAYSPNKKSWKEDEYAGNSNGDAVKAIETDGLGHIWILSDQYVKEYNPANRAFRILRNADRTVDMDYFHTISREGDSICIGGIGAFCMAAPSAELDAPSRQTVPVVSAVSIDGRARLIGVQEKKLQLEAGNTNVEFMFSTLEHLYADRISFAYRLAGWDTRWNYLPQGVNTAYYVNLPKGEYKLEVKATDRFGCWGQTVTGLTVERLPAWYETVWAYTWYAVCGILAIFGGCRAYFKRFRQRQEEQMKQQLTEMKLRFFTNVSHDLRTPLTLIMTPLSSLLTTVSDEHVRRQLNLIYRHAQDLLQLINRLLDFRKLQMEEEKLVLQYGDIGEFVYGAFQAFQTLADEKGVDFKYQSPEGSVFYMCFDRDKMHRVLYNLLNNAFKFTSCGGTVTVSWHSDGNRLRIEVRDTGGGIAPDELKHIFECYYQAGAGKTGTTTGSGIGLHIVKEYVEMHQGQVEAESTPGYGTVFRIELPTGLCVGADRDVPSDTMPDVQSPLEEGKRAAILVVEDNEELRRLLCKRLEQDYVVWEAENGLEAERIVLSKEIDVVVSDVMMPGMDGYELCNRLKNNIRASHVFIVLLTARGGDESKLKGYEAGADCYLTKPFNMEILLNRIRHLIALRQQRKRVFLQSVEVRAEDLTVSKIDEDFLKKAVEAIERNLDNTAYSVEKFSEDMCMSRMNLYRKLQMLTGQSPTEFIRGIRLKQAARLLEETALSVTEVADRVGFSTASYFSKCFKEMFGVLPTQYKK